MRMGNLPPPNRKMNRYQFEPIDITPSRHHRRFKTLSSLATHIENSKSPAKVEQGNRLIMAAIDLVAERMEAMRTLETTGSEKGVVMVPGGRSSP